MPINGLGGVSVYNPYAKINSGNQMKGVQLPGFGYGKGLMPTHTPSARSDEEIKNAIVELARQDARNGVWGADLDASLTNSRPSAEYQKLMGEYIQSVSPDRRSIYPAALTQLSKAAKLQDGKPIIDDSILQLFFGRTKVDVKNAGIQHDANSGMMEIHHFMIKAGGEDIGSYSITYGWGYTWTKEEQSRNLESSKLYQEAWRAEAAKMNAESNPARGLTYSGKTGQTTVNLDIHA